MLISSAWRAALVGWPDAGAGAGIPTARRLGARGAVTCFRSAAFSEASGPRAGSQMGIALPPVEPDLLGLVEGAHDEPDADGEQLDFRQRNPDVAGDRGAPCRGRGRARSTSPAVR